MSLRPQVRVFQVSVLVAVVLMAAARSMSPLYREVWWALTPDRAATDSAGVLSHALPPLAVGQNIPASPRTLAEVASAMGAAELHARGITGRGVKIGIIDESFYGYERLIGRALPEGIVTRSFHPEGLAGYTDRFRGELVGDGHGTAVAEIVHAVAPEAQLYFVNIDGREIVEFRFDTFAQAVDYLISEGVDIIAMSLGKGNAGPGDGTGPWNDIVNRGVDAGMLWIVSAGNSGEAHWGGLWNDPDGNSVLNFAGGDERNEVRFVPRLRVRVDLRWDEPWDVACTDLQVRVFSAINNTLEAASTQKQDCSPGSHPADTVQFRPQTRSRYYIQVVRIGGTGTPKLDLFVWTILGPISLRYATPWNSIEVPADNEWVLSVGAVSPEDPGVLEPYSSRGPTVDGRTKPDLVAPDGLPTITGIMPDTLVDPEFFGTSASAPLVAGAAALLKQLYPEWGAQAIKQALLSAAIDLGTPGKDNDFGAGRIDLRAFLR